MTVPISKNIFHIILFCPNFVPSVPFPKGAGNMMIYRVIRNDSWGFNNLPPRSPGATPCDFFLCVYVKDQVYVPPLPASIPELKVRIRTAIETITADTQQTVWKELDNRVDVCRITNGAHTEHL